LVDPIEAGKRIMILYAVAHSVHNPKDRVKLRDWLKEIGLWKETSPKEKALFEGRVKVEKELAAFSWQIEAAYILAWALGLVKEQPSPEEQMTEEQMETFVKNLPPLGSNLDSFYTGLQYIDRSEIHLENLFHELATAYFRDLLFNGNEDTTNIDRMASFERHKALNWLRSFGGMTEWDETDTST